MRTMRRAITFFGVSAAQSTFSVPALVWQSAQSKPRAAHMMPIVPMKSSTGMPFSTWTFLNTPSDIVFAGCGEASALPILQTAIITAIATISLAQRFIRCLSLLFGCGQWQLKICSRGSNLIHGRQRIIAHAAWEDRLQLVHFSRRKRDPILG